MARFAGVVTGAWTTAGTWNQVTNTPTIHATTNINISTSNLFTATFTAPNTTNATTGVLLYLATANILGGNITVTLQESTIDTPATATIASSAITASGTWVYFRFGTPHVWTTTGAGAYRFKVVNSSASNLPAGAADSGGANLAYLATDDRTGPPGNTDDIWITNLNQSGTITVTMDGTQLIGSGTDTTSAPAVLRSIGYGITLCNGGILSWDTASSATLTCKGTIVCGPGSGELRMGTSGSPYPLANTATLILDMAVSGQHTLVVLNGGKLTLQGAARSSTTLWKTTYVSGTGTAASPLVVADAVDWSVGDEIVVASTGTTATAYQESENKFIITKNSATSYVLSNTSGGAEAAFTYTHLTTARVFNLSRNVIVKGTSTSLLAGVLCQSSTAGDIDIDWTRFENMGGSTARGVILVNTIGQRCSCDYSVHYGNSTRHGFLWNFGTASQTYTGLIGHNAGANSAQGGALHLLSCTGVTLVDCVAIKNQGAGLSSVNSYGNSFTRLIAISNNLAAGSFGGHFLSTTGALQFTDCEIHANRTRGVFLSAGATDIVYSNLLCGTKGVNAIDVDVPTGSYNTVLFENGLFGSATLISGYTGLVQGGEISFHKQNQIANNHIWYTKYGTARSTGTGLTDTTVRTSDSLGVRIAPEENVTGFTWDFQVLAAAESIVNFFCYAQKNVAFGTSTAKFDLYLPGSVVGVDSPDDTQTLDNTTGSWQAVSISASYVGTVDGLATIRVTGITATASAYLYLDDFFNADTSNAAKFAALDVWHNGKPSQIIVNLAVTASDVWTFSTNNLTTDATTGKKLVDGLTTAKFIGLK